MFESPANKGKVSEIGITEHDNKEKYEIKKSDSKTELPPTVDKEAAQVKTRNQTGRSRQTQSGPLVPGSVLSHSLSERARNIERCVTNILLHLVYILVMLRQR